MEGFFTERRCVDERVAVIGDIAEDNHPKALTGCRKPRGDVTSLHHTVGREPALGFTFHDYDRHRGEDTEPVAVHGDCSKGVVAGLKLDRVQGRASPVLLGA